MKLFYSLSYVIFFMTFTIIHNGIAMEQHYQIIPALFARLLVHIDHDTLCIMALLNRTINNVIHETAENRKKHLESYIQDAPNLISTAHQRISWHPFGSTCAFINATKPSAYKRYFCSANFCQIYLALDDTFVTRKHLIAECTQAPKICINRPDAYHVPLDSMFWLDKEVILCPFFNRFGNACTYHYQKNKGIITADTPLTKELIINHQGFVRMAICMFEFNNERYPLALLDQTKYLHAFIKSTQVKKEDEMKIFITDGVTIDNNPLGQQDKRIINDRIDEYLYVKKESSRNLHKKYINKPLS